MEIVKIYNSSHICSTYKPTLKVRPFPATIIAGKFQYVLNLHS